MNTSRKTAAVFAERSVLLGVSDHSGLAQQLTREVLCHARSRPISIASTLPQLRDMSGRFSPAAILLDEELIGTQTVRRIPAPFVGDSSGGAGCLCGAMRRSYAPWWLKLAGGIRGANRRFCMPFAASLIERRLRWMDASGVGSGAAMGRISADIGEIFRHEINNPLTGILGNAELVLAHPANLSAVETQRLQTVADLAVRLRETVCRLSNACDRQPASAPAPRSGFVPTARPRFHDYAVVGHRRSIRSGPVSPGRL